MSDQPNLLEVEQALTLLVHSARVSPPLRDAVRLVEEDRRRLTWENDRLRSALVTARDFIRHHPAVSGTWPILNDLIDAGLRASDEKGPVATQPRVPEALSDEDGEHGAFGGLRPLPPLPTVEGEPGAEPFTRLAP